MRHGPSPLLRPFAKGLHGPKQVVTLPPLTSPPAPLHAGWAIQRIRQFYMRKVKHTQTTWHDKLTTILDDFPKARGSGWRAANAPACPGMGGRAGALWAPGVAGRASMAGATSSVPDWMSWQLSMEPTQWCRWTTSTPSTRTCSTSCTTRSVWLSQGDGHTHRRSWVCREPAPVTPLSRLFSWRPTTQDHYKLALGQLNAARGMIDKVAQVSLRTAGLLAAGVLVATDWPGG